MEFALLIYEDESRFSQGYDPQELAEYRAFGQQFSHALKGGKALQPTRTAATVRVRDGKAVTTDGPFAETKEHLAGYYIMNCEDLDGAIEWASKIPTQCSGGDGCIEIRPIRGLPAGPDAGVDRANTPRVNV